MKTFALKVATPFAAWVEKEAVAMHVHCDSGWMTVEVNHQPTICSLRAGLITISTPDGTEVWKTSPGFLKISRSDVTLLSESVEAVSRTRHN